jgi:hypothetical protein
MNEVTSKLKKYIDGTLTVMSDLTYQAVVTGAVELVYPLIITAVSLAVMKVRPKAGRVEQSKAPQFFISCSTT